MRVRFRVQLALLMALLCGFASDSAAQQLSLSGTVRDTGGVVPGALVTLASGGAAVATATTGGDGTYRFDGLKPGSYELTVAPTPSRWLKFATA